MLSGRKRSSSLRDSLEREETVVQEADSTVNILEHLGQVGAGRHLEGEDEEMEGGGEQGMKRARDDVPEMGVLKSLLEHTQPKPLEAENQQESMIPPTLQEPVKQGSVWGGMIVVDGVEGWWWMGGGGWAEFLAVCCDGVRWVELVSG